MNIEQLTKELMEQTERSKKLEQENKQLKEVLRIAQEMLHECVPTSPYSPATHTTIDDRINKLMK